MTHLRLRLNADFSGPHAWFFLAQERGYFRDQGLDLELLPGDGAAAIVPAVGHGGVEAGYGDINAFCRNQCVFGKCRWPGDEKLI